ncbi:MAG: SusC/RagA family TonB-linked outer membrane protein, partial [Dysgonamonadaceae bacterium]|nr:SusC/RagA family TonB-linked outer membrane protein [Dysgonamonadaceae bacterium]
MVKNYLKLLIGCLAFFFFSASMVAQSYEVSGKVSDPTGESLIGVSIVIKGTTNGVTTDANGTYRISVPSPNTILVFSYIGYRIHDETVKGRSTVDVVMTENAQDLEEIVVIGYGVSKKSDLTGSVASVKAEDLEKFPASSVTEMLRGQAAGIQVTLDSAAPGGTSDVYIRGKRSLSSSQSPLYIIDGMIVPNINDLNSSDIESVEVLKDASSQAIYGSRASNGVIIITTKKGKEGKVSVDFNSYIGTQKFHRNFDLYTPEEWVTLRWWAKNNDGHGNIGTLDNMNYQTVLDDAIMYDAWQNQKFTDWEDLMLGNPVQYKSDISVRGGNDKLKFASGIGYYNQDGIVDKSGFHRANFRTNIDYAMYKWLDFGVNFSYAQAETKSNDSNFNQILTMPSLSQAYDSDGNLMRETTSVGDINPLWRNREYDQKQDNEYLNLSTFLNFKLFKGVSYRFSANIRSNNRESGQYRTKLYPASTGEGQIREFKRSNWLINNVINYQVPISNKDHKLSLTFIQEAEQDLQKTTGFDFINSTTDIFKWDTAASSEIDNVVRDIQRVRSLSFAGRLQYNLMNRYLLTTSFRRDGASVFGADNKWANFPSVALAWRINEESFLKSQEWLDMLKTRVSYGIVGNWGIPAYRTLGLANSYEYILGNSLSVGYLPSNQLQNLSLKWEKTGSLNTGLDFSTWGGKLSGTIEYYNTKTTDLLVQRTIPSITGYSTMWDNLGETKSWGWEGTVNSRIIHKKDFNWEAGFSISTQRNEVVKIDGRVDENGKPLNDINNGWFIGKSINVAYQYEFAGIWQEGENPTEDQYLPGSAVPKPGDIKLTDSNGDGKITVDDRKVFNLDPQWYGTINTNLYFKGIDLGVEFYTV